MEKMCTDKQCTALRAFHQGTLHGQEGSCPLCGEDITFIHLLWQCSFWKGRVKDLPDQWHERLQAGTEPELWNRGMTQSLFYIPDGGMATFNGEGLWSNLETLPVGAGQAFSVAIAPTCRDPRHRRFAFAICIHNVHSKERIASITGICPGHASRQRAFFYALKHLSLHINDKVQVPVFQHTTWKLWTWTAAFEHFPDLCQGLEQEDYDQVRLLLLSGSDLNSSHNRKLFQKDAQAKATQAAILARPEEILDLQRQVDEDTRGILFVATNRMEILLTS